LPESTFVQAVTVCQQRRHITVFCYQSVNEPANPNPVQQFKRAVFPVVPEAHGGIYGDYVVGNLGNQAGAINEGIGQHFPAILAHCLVANQKIPQFILRPGQIRQGKFSLFLIFASLQVMRLFNAFTIAGLQTINRPFLFCRHILRYHGLNHEEALT
jgi:hypothetical protein